MLLGALLLMFSSRDVIFRTANLNHSDFLDYFMFGLTELGDGIAATVILLLMPAIFKSCRNWWFVLAALICNVAPALLVQVVKSLVNAPRPLKYYELDPSWIHLREHWPRLFERSFPSGHSACIFSLCCFLAMILPKSVERWGLGFFILALLVAYSRMYVAAHFYADIFVGSLLGTLGTIFCFALMRRWSNKSFVIVRSQTSKEP
jgi:membrane-associated phospholipid phosphatase